MLRVDDFAVSEVDVVVSVFAKFPDCADGNRRADGENGERRNADVKTFFDLLSVHKIENVNRKVADEEAEQSVKDAVPEGDDSVEVPAVAENHARKNQEHDDDFNDSREVEKFSADKRNRNDKCDGPQRFAEIVFVS